MNNTFLTRTRDCDLTEDAVDLICKKVICAAVLYTVHVFISLVIAINVGNISQHKDFHTRNCVQMTFMFLTINMS